MLQNSTHIVDRTRQFKLLLRHFKTVVLHKKKKEKKTLLISKSIRIE